MEALNIPSKCLNRSSRLKERHPRGHSRVSVDVRWYFIRNHIGDQNRESVEGELLTPRKAEDVWALLSSIVEGLGAVGVEAAQAHLEEA